MVMLSGRSTGCAAGSTSTFIVLPRNPTANGVVVDPNIREVLVPPRTATSELLEGGRTAATMKMDHDEVGSDKSSGTLKAQPTASV
jgi:hypothetical protein